MFMCMYSYRSPFKKKCVGPLSPFLLPVQKYLEVVGKGRLGNLLLTRHYICVFLFQLYVTFPDAESYKRQSYQCFFSGQKMCFCWLFCSKYISNMKLYQNAKLTLSLIRINSSFIYLFLTVKIVPLL